MKEIIVINNTLRHLRIQLSYLVHHVVFLNNFVHSMCETRLTLI